MNLNLTVKRQDCSQLASALRSSSDPAYVGGGTFGGVDASGNPVTVTVQFVDETPNTTS